MAPAYVGGAIGCVLDQEWPLRVMVMTWFSVVLALVCSMHCGLASFLLMLEDQWSASDGGVHPNKVKMEEQRTILLRSVTSRITTF